MILILLRDGNTLEIPTAFDVIHKAGLIECIDAWGESLQSFSTEDVFAYSLNPRVVDEFFAVADEPNPEAAKARHRVGQASEKLRVSAQDLL
jgi:hypothetical protein